MSEIEIAGFWSYAHEDDRVESGRVLELAENIRSEFSLLTGEELVLFVDRSDIAWGDEWRQRIDDALVQTTFFIPIITPRYFKRAECRKELLDFIGQAGSLGVSELVLPILYVEVPNLEADNVDEAVSIVAKTQYVDWRALRVAGASSQEYRAAVNSVATRLIEIGNRIAQKQIELEDIKLGESAEDSEVDLSDLLGRIAELLPEWHEAVVSDSFTTVQHKSVMELHKQRMRKLASAPAGAKFSELQRFAAKEAHLAEQNLKDAQVYLAKTVELDPYVSALSRTLVERPALVGLASELLTAIDDAVKYIRESERILKEDPSSIPMQQFAKENAYVSRTMRSMGATYEAASSLISDANTIVLRWYSQLPVAKPGEAAR